jgi:hypothetical protein
MSINYVSADPWSSGIRINKRGATGNANAAIANGTELGYHGFYGWNGSAFGRSAMVYAASEQNFSAGNHGGRLAFYTTPVGANDVSERMRITPSGQVSIGRTDPPAYQTLNVSAPDQPVVSVEDVGNGVAYLAQAGSVTLLGAQGEFRIRNGVNYGSGPIASGTDRMTINTSGHRTEPFQPVWSSDITSSTNNYSTFSASVNVGFTLTNSSTITVQTAGKYYVRAQQLLQTSGGGYYQLRKNNVTVKHAYAATSSFMDYTVGALLDLAAGDTIRIVAAITLTNSWNSEHSTLDIIKVA